MSDSTKELELSKQNFLKSISTAFLAPIHESLETLDKIRATNEPCSQSKSVNYLETQLQKLRLGVQNIIYLTAITNSNLKGSSGVIATLKELEDFVGNFQDLAKEQGIHYLIYIDPNFPRDVTCEKEYIFHILSNLLTNALLYTPAKGNVYLDIRSKNIENKYVELSFSVTDTGIGIPKEKVKRMLKPFASNDAKGMGLGISSSYYLLKSLGSQLKIASEENKGSRFSFSVQAKTKFVANFKPLPALNVGVLIDSRELIGHAKIFYQYFISMGVNVVTVNDINDEKIKSCQALFMLTVSLDIKKQEFLAKHAPTTRIIPSIMESYLQTFEENFGQNIPKLILPAVPTKIYELLDFVQKNKLTEKVIEPQEPKPKTVPVKAVKKDDEPLKILVVEDNPINLKLVQIVLGRYDLIIDSAHNGEVAVKMCKKTHYDLILMDIDMPTMDGITANRLIKEFETREGIPHTPVVALTSHDLAGERAKILALGLDEHMSKPLNVARLETMLDRYLGYKNRKK